MNPTDTDTRLVHLSDVRERLARTRAEINESSAAIREANERLKRARDDERALELLLTLGTQYATCAKLEPDAQCPPL